MNIRKQLIASGTIVPHADLHDMYLDNVQAPSWSQPWHKNDAGLRIDVLGKFWTALDVQESVELDYDGEAPSIAAARFGLPRGIGLLGAGSW